MQWIDKHQKQDNGLYSVVIRNVELSNKELLILDNGLDVEVEVKPVDPYAITNKQRRKIFALCNDIEEHTGQPREYMRYMFMDYVAFVEGYDRLSLSNCS
ncbi:putative HNHc nuclease, partial [Staphylococcus delphini]|uniref:putative HNHc nuclease n=2 Tax=Staphylococcus intermedius group TaxID=2815305 RepID=UPI000BD3CA52